MTHRGSGFLLTVATAALLCPTSVDAQTREVAFSTDEGTWLSLDVSPSGDGLVFELLGDIYALSRGGGRGEARADRHRLSVAAPLLTRRSLARLRQ